MEAGNLTQKVESPLETATFLTKAKSRTLSAFKKNKRSYSDIKIKTKKCAFCHEIGRTPVNCTKVTTAYAHMNIVKSERLCLICLGHHKLADCKSKSYCRNCYKRHHTSLCNKDEKSEESSKPQAKETGNTVLHSSLTQRTTHLLLKTVVANVSSGKQSTEANILFDKDAQRFFITETFAE
ncbi:unnamed protein product [Mytilus coruscus]|uniref:Uncharacterized protein n=1 Tax=Mytilus coruscus TaxID=42192 RepID=A0A6J8B3F8_MYTCO|nr:unnamed protein product [Mytilus coruscus]